MYFHTFPDPITVQQRVLNSAVFIKKLIASESNLELQSSVAGPFNGSCILVIKRLLMGLFDSYRPRPCGNKVLALR